MKIVDNTALRQVEEEERLRPIRELQEKAALAKKKEAEEKALIVSVPCDWRIHGELEPLTKAIWDFEVNELRKGYLKAAIKNRKSLEQLVVEPFETESYTISVKYDQETINVLKKESSNLGLSVDEYARYILYTTALKENTERKEKLKQEEEKKEALRKFDFNGQINHELRKKLTDKFHDPIEERKEFGFWIDASKSYGEFLVAVANEYFGIKNKDTN
ncbi:hypothetical protein K7887_22035 (plasmid) [Sutcliffiella horikoshii]|uniref:hypothetical protein n=1 Tax=Sutcliffiella horikoshii TaxID=79883 RepID=UPI001CBFFCA1|nr:hypothetical protein [Sutcliffiella horikoshii]UAL49728.1 hypothetical protein K7887_22035 [Sutcliffiella horikoshii]